MLKSQTVAEKMAKTFRGPLFSAAPCRSNGALVFMMAIIIKTKEECDIVKIINIITRTTSVMYQRSGSGHEHQGG